MNLTKASLTINGNDLHIAMPIVKVDKEHRTVSGFATLDNVDTQGDLVTAEASRAAFNAWRGNIREMHGKNAVGKAIDFQEKTFYNPDDQQTYRGMWVTAYVSKGAPDTWEKVCDGTLAGFSIGGSVLKAVDVFNKGGSAVRKVEEYLMTELSLVDNPANQLANILSFQKVNGVLEADGMITKMSLQNIHWCKADSVAVAAEDEKVVCSSCGNDMKVIGWVEADDDEKAAAISKAIAEQTSSQPTEGLNSNNAITGMQDIDITVSGVDTEKIAKQVLKYLQLEGGVDVSKRTAIEKSAEGDERKAEAVGEGAPASGPAATNADTVQPAAEVDEPKAEEVSEVQEPDLAKMFSDLRDSLAGAIENSKTETEKVLGEVQSSIEKSVGDISNRVSEFETKLGELGEQVSELSKNQKTVEKTVDSVVSATAIKKSNDLGGSSDDEQLEKTNFWGGAFIDAKDLVR